MSCCESDVCLLLVLPLIVVAMPIAAPLIVVASPFVLVGAFIDSERRKRKKKKRERSLVVNCHDYGTC